jgi:hypothetical protein
MPLLSLVVVARVPLAYDNCSTFRRQCDQSRGVVKRARDIDDSKKSDDIRGKFGRKYQRPGMLILLERHLGGKEVSGDT